MCLGGRVGGGEGEGGGRRREGAEKGGRCKATHVHPTYWAWYTQLPAPPPNYTTPLTSYLVHSVPLPPMCVPRPAAPSGYRPPPGEEDELVTPPHLLRLDTSALPRTATGLSSNHTHTTAALAPEPAATGPAPAAVPAIELSPAVAAAAAASPASGSSAHSGGAGSPPTSGSAAIAAAAGEVVMHVGTKRSSGSGSGAGAVDGKGGAVAVTAHSGGGTNLSFRPVVFAFEGVNYFVPNPKGTGEQQQQQQGRVVWELRGLGAWGPGFGILTK